MKNGFDITSKFDGTTITPEQFDFHITIFYTNEKFLLKNGQFQIDKVQIVPERFNLLGKEHNIPVIQVKKTPELLNIRKIYEYMGLTDEWPEYKPHISLSYAWQGTPDMTSLSLPDFEIYVDQIVIKNQK